MIDPAGGTIAERISRELAERYRVQRELGRGGMATVFLADDLRHGRPVAIKVLHQDLGALMGAERFLAEIRITAKLQHPHILPLLDSGRVSGGSGEDDLLYYVMPYVDGETLRARLRREQQLPLAEAVRIATEVASALAYAHAAGVIHRDIKPENILLGAPHAGVAPSLLSDFGIARSLDAATDRITGTGVTVGTPAYMSPEQATAERDIDARSDVYSLACVVYEMLAGEPPFSGPNPRAVLSKQLSDPVRPVRRLRDGVPQYVDDALAVALSRSAADRFPDAASFGEALLGRASLVRSDVGATRADARVEPAGRRRVPLGLLAIAAILLAGAVAAWATRSRAPAMAEIPSIRIQRFTTAPGDTASAYLAATLRQDVTVALAASHAVHVFVMDSTRLPSGYAVGATAARLADSVEVKLVVTTDPTGEFKGQRIVRRPIGRVHELPELATSAILSMLDRPRQTKIGRAPTTDSIAYDLFLRGRYQTDRRTEASTQHAVALLRAAVQRDSSFAEGWAGLATALQRAHLRGYRIPGVPGDRILRLMYEASDRALEADSTRSFVWVARGLTIADLEPSSRRNTLLAYQRAIALDSNDVDAWHYAAVAWDDSLEPARAVASWRHVLRLDPTHRQALGFLSQHYAWMRQPDSAIFWADSALRIDPAYYFARQQLALAQLLGGAALPAAENFRAAIRLGPGPDEVVAWIGLTAIAMQRGDRVAADTLFARALALVDTLHPALHDAVYVAWGYSARGDRTRAVHFLERFDPRTDSHFQLHLHCEAGLDPLRALPAFRALIVRASSSCPAPG
jgi:tetratricopeptide (TPR) repeat protein/tRNA A-37 threonylcarbamoyl transferase component Bud32